MNKYLPLSKERLKSMTLAEYSENRIAVFLTLGDKFMAQSVIKQEFESMKDNIVYNIKELPWWKRLLNLF